MQPFAAAFSNYGTHYNGTAKMKRTLTLTLGAAILASAVVSPASADWHGYHGWHGGYHGWHHHHGWWPGAALGLGLVVRPPPVYYPPRVYYPPPTYYVPPPAYVPPPVYYPPPAYYPPPYYPPPR